MLLLHTEGKGQSFTQHLVWGPFPPLDHCGKIFQGLSADDKLSPPPSAQVHLGQDYSSAPSALTQTQDQWGGRRGVRTHPPNPLVPTHPPSLLLLRESRGGGG